MSFQRLGPIAALITVLGSCASSTPAGPRQNEAMGAVVGAHVPRVALKGFDGRELRSDALEGKVVLLDVWASWCAPCKEELPLLDEIARRLKSRGVEILAVSIDEDRDAALEFLKVRKAWSIALAHDPQGRLADRLKPSKMPTSYIIDRAGIVRYVNAGFDRADAAQIERRLTTLASPQ